MKHYELYVVLPGTLTEDEVTPLSSTVEATLAEQGATNVMVEDLGKNRLAYPMKQIRYGYTRVMYFDAEPSAIPVINQKLRLMPELLRAMIHLCDKEGLQDAKTKVAKIKAENKDRKGKSADQKAPSKAEKSAPKKEAEEAPAVSDKDIDEKLDKILDDTIAKV